MVRQCIDALGQFQNSSLLELQEDREQVLGMRKFTVSLCLPLSMTQRTVWLQRSDT